MGSTEKNVCWSLREETSSWVQIMESPEHCYRGVADWGDDVVALPRTYIHTGALDYESISHYHAYSAKTKNILRFADKKTSKS